MNKKGSMELSVNSIVILVIAIVMLGLILGFVKTKFSQLDNNLGSSEPDAPVASASKTLTMSRDQVTVNSGEELGLKFSVYADTAVNSGEKISFKCNNVDWVKSPAPGKDITQGNSESYIVILKVPGTAAKGKQVCTAAVGNRQGIDVLVEVK